MKTMVILWDKAYEKIGCGHIVSFVNYQDSQTYGIMYWKGF